MIAECLTFVVSKFTNFLNEAHSPLAVIYLTGHGDVPMAVDALQAGAVNFFQKPVKGDELAQAILHGQMQSAASLDMVAARAAYESLTPREKDILRLIIAGKRNIRIADELCIAMRTVEVHRASLLKKFSAKPSQNWPIFMASWRIPSSES